MSARQPTVDDVTTTNTLEVWRDKLHRESRAKNEWHYRWGPTFGQPSVPENAEVQWRPNIGPMPSMPPPGRVPQLIEPTASSLKWDAAVARGSVPLRAPSIASSASGAPSLPGMRPVSISSSADRRRELLQERHTELQAQLALVEEMLKQAKPSTMFSMMSGVSAASKRTGKSVASARSGRSGASGSMTLAAPAATAYLDSLREEGPVEVPGGAPPTPQPPVPLCLDPNDADYNTLSAFRSGAGTSFALPGTKLSSISYA